MGLESHLVGLVAGDDGDLAASSVPAAIANDESPLNNNTKPTAQQQKQQSNDYIHDADSMPSELPPPALSLSLDRAAPRDQETGTDNDHASSDHGPASAISSDDEDIVAILVGFWNGPKGQSGPATEATPRIGLDPPNPPWNQHAHIARRTRPIGPARRVSNLVDLIDLNACAETTSRGYNTVASDPFCSCRGFLFRPGSVHAPN